MSINEQQLSRSSGGQNFKLWGKSFVPEKQVISEVDGSTDGAAVIGVRSGSRKTNPSVGSMGPGGKSGKANSDPKVTNRKDYDGRDPAELSSNETSQNQESQFDSHKPKVSLERPKLKLDPFQEAIYYSLIPVENIIETENNPYNRIHGSKQDGIERLPITASSVVGESGSGLTLMLAKKAYENYQDGRPTIILTHREHLFHKVAQSIVDFADPQKRKNLLDSIEVIHADDDLSKIDPNKKIYIISADKLVNYLEDNSSYRPDDGPRTFARMAWKQPAHNRIREILPLNRIREILVDEANIYTGTANEGYTKLLATLLKETSRDPSRNPVHLFGTSSTPYPRGESQNPLFPTLEFNRFFPQLSLQETPSPRELIEELKFYKRPILSSIELKEDVQKEMAHRDAKLRLYDSSNGSINDNIVSLYQREAQINPNKKWHIIANDIQHANQLCALFNSRAINAKVATSDHRGSFKLLGQPLTETDSKKGIFELNDAAEDSKKTQLKKIREPINRIIDEYENGNCSVIIDIDFKSCIHSTKTDKVIVLNLNETDSRTKHLLGEAVRDRSGPSYQSIEYMFLRPNTLESFDRLITGNDFNLAAVPKTTSNASNSVNPDPLRTETDMTVNVIGGIVFNRNWLDNGLRSVLEARYPSLPLEEAAQGLTKDFESSRLVINKSFDELKDIVTGLSKDTEVFRQFIKFLDSDLRVIFQKNLNRINIDLQQELTILIPDLMGVPNEDLALRILAKSYENLVLNDTTFKPDEQWQVRMDAALGLSDKDRGEVRENQRNKLFTRIIARKFGLEFFENRFFIEKALKVFNGSEIDFKLFGLLVNVLSSNEESSFGKGFSFDDIRQEFPHLLGSQRIVPFAALQRKILAKYPEGPPMDQNLTRFFREQLYDDFAIDFATLTNSVTNHSRATDPDQEIINGSVQDEIYKFLEAVYTAEANSEMPSTSPLRPKETRFNLEVNAKAQEHLSTITREVLYNQLIAKIWGQGRSAQINNDDFVFELRADELSLKPKPDSSLEDQIDMTKVHADWLIAIDHGINGSSFDRVDIKKRIAAIAGTFLAVRHSIGSRVQEAINTKNQEGDEYLVLSANQRYRHNILDGEINPRQVFLDRGLNALEQRELQVILGTVAKEDLSSNDRTLLREFAQQAKLKPQNFIPRFYDRVGVNNLDEAKLVIHSELKKLLSSNPEWMKLFGSQDEFVSHLAEFLYNNSLRKDIFTRPESLIQSLMILSGNLSRAKAEGKLERAQNLNREFIKFLNTKSLSLKTEELVLNFREQIGLRNREELFALMRQPGFVNFADQKNTDNPNKWENVTSEGVVSFVSKIASKLELEPSAVFALAGLKEPSSFYREPLSDFREEWDEKIDFDSSIKEAITNELDILLSNENNSIKARQLLIDVYGEEYKHSSVFILPGAERFTDTAKLRVDIKGNQIIFTDEQLNPRFGEKNEKKRIDVDFYEYSFLDDRWQLTKTQDDISKRYYRISQAISRILTSSKLDEKWLKHLGITKDSKPEDIGFQQLVKVIDAYLKFLFYEDRNSLKQILLNNDLFERYMKTFLGDYQGYSKAGIPNHQANIRAFIKFWNNPHFIVDNELVPLNNLELQPIDLDQVIKESPKLTGVQSYRELELAVSGAYKSLDQLRNGRANYTTDVLVRELASLTATDESILLGFEEVQAKYESYFEGLNVSGITEEISKALFAEEEYKTELKRGILSRLLFDETKEKALLALVHQFTKSDGKRLESNFYFTESRIQTDFFELSSSEKDLFAHRTTNLSQDGWKMYEASQNEVQARRVLMKLQQHNFTDLQATLMDAMDEAIGDKNRYDYMFFNVSSLITKFIEAQYPTRFGGDDMAVESMFRILFGMSVASDNTRKIANDFIDFAQVKHPGFAALRNDPKFKEVFFEIKG